MSKKSYVFDPKTKKMVEKIAFSESNNEKTAFVHDEIDAFVSPVDGSVIDSRRKLREHNKKHGVTDMRDYGPQYFERKQRERDEILSAKVGSERKGRIEAIQEAIYRSEHR